MILIMIMINKYIIYKACDTPEPHFLLTFLEVYLMIPSLTVQLNCWN